MKSNYLVQAWLILLLAICFGAALAGVQATLKPRIDANKLEDTVGQIPNLVPGAVSGEAEVVGDQSAYRALDESGEQIGWVIVAGGQGFADRIELLIGVDKNVSTITGLYILDQKETPGLGNKIVEDQWRNQFKEKATTAALVATRGASPAGNEIEAITGATISSESVVGIVNAAVAKFRVAVANDT